MINSTSSKDQNYTILGDESIRLYEQLNIDPWKIRFFTFHPDSIHSNPKPSSFMGSTPFISYVIVTVITHLPFNVIVFSQLRLAAVYQRKNQAWQPVVRLEYHRAVQTENSNPSLWICKRKRRNYLWIPASFHCVFIKFSEFDYIWINIQWNENKFFFPFFFLRWDRILKILKNFIVNPQNIRVIFSYIIFIKWQVWGKKWIDVY